MLDILVVLDRSGSMMDAKADHEGGLKSFVEDQKALDGDVRFTLIQFDTSNPCEVVYDRVKLDAVTKIELVPRGGTPLLDAMGMALDHLTKHQPDEVVCFVVTDGAENSSREWTKERVKARVAELETKGWNFLYLGANVDAFGEAGTMGMAAAGAINYANTPVAVNALYAATASNLGGYRSMRSKGQSVQSASHNLTWSDEQRAEVSGSAAPNADAAQNLLDNTNQQQATTAPDKDNA